MIQKKSAHYVTVEKMLGDKEFFLLDIPNFIQISTFEVYYQILIRVPFLSTDSFQPIFHFTDVWKIENIYKYILLMNIK